MAKRIKAVFFDLDGVLVDSEYVSQSFINAFAKEKGLPIPPERFYQLIGSHKSLNPWQKILDGIEIGQSIESLEKELWMYLREKRKNCVMADWVFPETEDCLKELKQEKLFIACASSSHMEYIQEILQSSHLFNYFDLIVTSDDFEKSKPAPDIYCYCMNYFHLNTTECLVVEDSTLGIAAGKAAGLRVIARRDHRFGMDQSQADEFIEDLRELFPLIES